MLSLGSSEKDTLQNWSFIILVCVTRCICNIYCTYVHMLVKKNTETDRERVLYKTNKFVFQNVLIRTI